MWETHFRALGWEDPLEKGMATHSSTLAWKIPWTEEPGRLQTMELQRVRHDWETSLSFFLSVENIPSYNPDHFLFCTFMRKNREKLSNLETVQWTFGDIYFQGLYYKARALYLIFHFMFHSRYPDSSSFSMTFFSSVTHLKGMMSSKWFCLSHTHSISP